MILEASEYLEARQGQSDQLDPYHHPVQLAPEGLMGRVGLHCQTGQLGLGLLLVQFGPELLFLR